MYYVKLHFHGKDTVLAICDPDLLGKRFEEGDLILEVSEEFYGGRLASLDEVLDLIKKSSIVNIVGEKILKELSKRGLMVEESVIYIGGIPHLQIISL
ncbi:MAG: DUF424 family protein [Thermoproteales archaeon]|nr:DUF424 family protein [Thermoproteales archaeon]